MSSPSMAMILAVVVPSSRLKFSEMTSLMISSMVATKVSFSLSSWGIMRLLNVSSLVTMIVTKSVGCSVGGSVEELGLGAFVGTEATVDTLVGLYVVPSLGELVGLDVDVDVDVDVEKDVGAYVSFARLNATFAGAAVV